jgi:tRNA 2-thiouridine synthesizing protein D
LRKNEMATITVVVGDPPYGKERVYTALRFSLVALHEGHQVNLFILEDAVFAAKRGQKPPEMPVGDAGMPNCEELLGASIQEGLKVKACRVCSANRGLMAEELIEGVEMASMVDLVNWVVNSDRTVCF